MRREIKVAASLLFGGLSIFFMIAAIYHHIMLKRKRNKIKHIGTTVEVDVYDMNAYLEEKKSDTNATIVLLSGYEGWVKAQEDFAKRAKNCLLIKLDCGHNLHYYKSEYIVEKIKEFMKDQ